MGKGRVMISARHSDTRQMMHVLLDLWGYEVIEACSNDDAVDLAESRHPQLVLVDTSCKFEEDMEVVTRLRHSHLPPSVPVIVMSTYPQAEYQKAAFEHGASGHLVKPLDLDLLENYLETCLAEVG